MHCMGGFERVETWGRRLLRLLAGSVLGVVFLASGAPVASVQAAGCTNERIRSLQAYASRLPDCRAYEQASPVEKNLIDAVGLPLITQASPSGGAVSFFSTAPFPGSPGAAVEPPTYLGIRAAAGEEWSLLGLLPPAAPGTHESRIVGLTEDLSRTILRSEEPSLAPGAATGPATVNDYVRDNATGAYQLLAPNVGYETLVFDGATPGGARVLFETNANLATTNVAPAAGAPNLYEWDEAKPLGQRVSLAGVLPGGEAPASGSVAGAGGPIVGLANSEGEHFYTQHTISEDGARIFFSDHGTGLIYMREPQAQKTIQLSGGGEPAYWRAATPDGKYVFYTEGNELYRFNVDQFEHSAEPEPKALAEAREQLTTGAEGVQGTLGISDDGSYVYFVAPGKLASNTNGNGEEAEQGKANLYELHVGSPAVFVLRFGFGGGTNWQSAVETTGSLYKTARVTPDGKAVLLASGKPLTSYNTEPLAGRCDGNPEPACIELYLYSADSKSLTCVSCNPTGTQPTAGAYLTIFGKFAPTSTPRFRNAFLTRNLSTDGDRVFFETEEGLLPQDENGVTDVYEWEREGAPGGSCATGAGNGSGGCLYLISTGQSPQRSRFGDASADGSNVFLFTRQSLVGQDQDNNADVYDARVGGGIAAQNPEPTPAPCSGEGCREGSEAPPVFGVPSSSALSGAGNLLSPSPPVKGVVKCAKGKRLSRGKCVKVKAKCAKGRRFSRGKCVKLKAKNTRKAHNHRRGK
jgi:hypothetical protein